MVWRWVRKEVMSIHWARCPSSLSTYMVLQDFINLLQDLNRFVPFLREVKSAGEVYLSLVEGRETDQLKT